MNYLKKSLRCLFFILPFFAVSCISPLDQTDIYNQTKSEKTVLVTGSIAPELQGAFPKEIIDGLINNENDTGKTAYPTIGSSATFLYRIIADEYDDSGNITGQPRTFDLTDTSTGTPTKNQSYSIPLPFGKWKLTAKVYLNTNENYAPQKLIMQGECSEEIIITESTPGVLVSDAIVVQPVVTETGTGKIELTVDVDNDGYSGNAQITKIQYKALENVDSTEGDKNFNNTVKITTKNSAAIKSGTYTYEIKFFDDNGNLVYQCYEKVNVYDNLTTNTWCGNSEYFFEEDGVTKFKITKQCRDNFKKSIIYVQAGNDGFSDEDDTTGDGSKDNPYRSLKTAITKMEDINNVKYTILLKGDMKIKKPVSPSSSLYIDLRETENVTIIGTDSDGNPLENSKVNIQCVNSSGIALGADESPEYQFLNTSTCKNITLKNIAIKDFGSKTNISNNPIKITGNPEILNFTAINCEFANCKSITGNSGMGGAIYCENCNVILEKCNFNSCIGNGDSSSDGKGGALFLKKSNCKIIDSTFKKCQADLGAAIYATAADATAYPSLEIMGNCIFGDERVNSVDNISNNNEGNVAKTGILYLDKVKCTITGNTKFIGNQLSQSSVIEVIGSEIDSTQYCSFTIGNKGAANNLSPNFIYNLVKHTDSSVAEGSIIKCSKSVSFNFNSGIISGNRVNLSINTTAKTGSAGVMHYRTFSKSISCNYNGGIIKDNLLVCNSNNYNSNLYSGGILNKAEDNTVILGNVILSGNKYGYSGNFKNNDLCLVEFNNNPDSKVGFISNYLGNDKINLDFKSNNGYSEGVGVFINNNIEIDKNNCYFFDCTESGYYIDYINGKILPRNTGTNSDICNINDTTSQSGQVYYVYDQKGLEKIKKILDTNDSLENPPLVGQNFYQQTIKLQNDIVVVNLETLGSSTDSKQYFEGTFDGNGHTITIKSVKDGCKALFGYVDRGKIQNLTLKGDFTVNDSFYSFAEKCDTIENCTNNCNITCTVDGKTITGFCNTMTSGLDGFKNCKNTGNLTCKNGSVYGIACETIGSSPTYYIKDSSNTGNLTGKNVAGIIGEFCGQIINCSNTGTLEGENVGGIARQYYSYADDDWNHKNYNQIPTPSNDYTGTGILNCYNNGDINYTGGSSGYAGGIVGMAKIENEEFGKVIIQNCVNYKAINGSGTKGGIIGKISNATLADCQLFKYNYYNNATSPAIGNNEIEINESTNILLSFATTGNSPGQLNIGVSLGSDPVNNYYIAVNNWIQYIGGATDYSFYKQWVAENVNQKIPYIF